MSDKFTDSQLFNFISGSETTGQSSYELWKSLGNEGTPEDFLEFLKDNEDVYSQVEDNKQNISKLSEQKADKSELTNQFNFKGSTTFAELPMEGNEVNDTYYCTDMKRNYSWNGTEWSQSSIDESVYLEELSQISEQIDGVTEDVNSLYETRFVNIPHNVKSVTTMVMYDGRTAELDGIKAMDLTVNQNEVCVVRGNISASMALWCVYDKDGVMIAYDNVRRTTSGFVEVEITMPENAHMLRAFGYYNTEVTIKCKRTYFKPTLNYLSDKKWVAFGDSLTDPHTLQGGKNYVDFIALESGCNAINLGVGGSGLLKNQKYYSRVDTIPSDTDVISIIGSFNDYSFIVDGNLGTAEDDGNVDTPTTLGGALNKFLIELYKRCPDIKIVIISPICWTWNCSFNGDRRENSEKYVKLLEDIAKKWSAEYLDLFHSANIRLWDSDTSKKYTINDDGTHLTEEAHREFIYKKVMAKLNVSC